MGHRRRVRDTGKAAPTRIVIDRHNRHSRETYQEIVRRTQRERAIDTTPRYLYGDKNLGAA